MKGVGEMFVDERKWIVNIESKSDECPLMYFSEHYFRCKRPLSENNKCQFELCPFKKE